VEAAMKPIFSPKLIKVIYFDMNHTLLDAHQAFNESFLYVLKEYTGRWEQQESLSPQQALNRYWEEWNKRTHSLGRKTPSAQNKEQMRQASLGAALLSYPFSLQSPFLKTFLQKVKERQENWPKLRPHVQETLSFLGKHYRLAILSNSTKEKREQQIMRLGLNTWFPSDHLFTPNKHGVRKPNPLFFKRALDALEIQPNQAVMVGDSWKNDILGAIRSHMDAVWIRPEHAKKSSLRKIGSRKVAVVRSIEQLQQLFK
jgi:putative hydrolase of the HAD superfamily